MAGRPWTDEELHALADISLSVREVMELTGRSYHAVTCKSYRLGVVRRREWTPEEDRRIRKSIDRLSREMRIDPALILGRAMTLLNTGGGQ